MKRFLLLGFLIVIFVVLFKNPPINILQEKITKSTGEQLSSQYRVTKNDPFEIHSFEVAPVVGRTEIFTNQSKDPILSLDGFYYDSMFIDLDTNNGNKIFEIQLNAGGKLINSHLYQYSDNQLRRIPVITNSSSGNWDIWSSGGTNFVDTDHDGIKEMLVHYSKYLDKPKVEVYKFDDGIFQKDYEYEEVISNADY